MKTDLVAISTDGISYRNFIDGVRAPATKKVYEDSLIRYCRHLKLPNIDDLLKSTNQKTVESQIVDYIMTLRQEGVSFATIKFLIAPIFSFYQLNDIFPNRKRVNRNLGEFKRVVRDQAYTTEQIQQMLQNADSRMRCIILILCGTGCRIGALPSLTLGNLERIPEYGLYKITFYENTSSEHYGYCTRECAQTGIENYLNYRKRSGESISFNENTNRWEPGDVPLIRLQFDINDLYQVRHPQPIKLEGLRMAMYYHLIKSGIRQVEHLTENGSKRVRKPVSFAMGFRKFTVSSFIQAQVNYDVRQYLVDHKGGYLDKSYARLGEDFIISEYMKAEPYLTIDDSLRLKQENQILKVNIDKYEGIFSRIEMLEKQMQEKLE